MIKMIADSILAIKLYFIKFNFLGICSGPIIAGVVGSKKPLYDIWGDAVNMASRMDSTGIANHTQVMEPTADIIRRIGFECEYRGETFVKGKDGLVKTYFVKMDSNFNLIRTNMKTEYI